MTHEHEARLVSTGIQQEANEGRQQHAKDRLERAEAYALKSQTHLWVVLVAYQATDAILDAQEGIQGEGLPLLDLDNMLGQPSIGCYVCEQPYDSRQRFRKCPGERA